MNAEKWFWYTLYVITFFAMPYIMWKVITLGNAPEVTFLGSIMLIGWLIFFPLLGRGMYQDLNEK